MGSELKATPSHIIAKQIPRDRRADYIEQIRRAALGQDQAFSGLKGRQVVRHIACRQAQQIQNTSRSSFPCRSRPAGESWRDAMPVASHESLAGKFLQRQCSVEAMAQALKKFLSLSVQPSSVGVCLAPPFLTESSKSLSSLRWCSVSLTGVSMDTWQ